MVLRAQEGFCEIKLSVGKENGRSQPGQQWQMWWEKETVIFFFSFIRAGEESITEHRRAEERGREAEQEEMMLELGRNFEE